MTKSWPLSLPVALNQTTDPEGGGSNDVMDGFLSDLSCWLLDGFLSCWLLLMLKGKSW